MSTAIAMSDILPLTEEGIKNSIRETKPGNFRLSIEKTKDGKTEYYVHYVGRSDSDVKTEIIQRGLTDLVDQNDLPKYSHFKYTYAKNADEAYLNECNDFHHFNGLDNKIHPATPKGSNVKCPVDGCEYSSKPTRK